MTTTALSKEDWVDALKLAVLDMEAAIANRDKVVREAVEAGLSYSQVAEAVGQSKGWVAGRVNRP